MRARRPSGRRPSRRPRGASPAAALAAPVLAAAALAGCHTSATPQDDMHATVGAFLQACASREPHYVFPMLVPAARDVFAHGTDVVRGCATILHIPAGEQAGLTQSDFDRASAHVSSFFGADGTVDVNIAGRVQRLRLAFGRPGWQIEGPG